MDLRQPAPAPWYLHVRLHGGVERRACGTRPEPYALFLFCGILPWTWFQSSLLESCSVLVAGGNLIRKVLFPAEILPAVTVLTGLVNFCLGLLVFAGVAI